MANNLPIHEKFLTDDGFVSTAWIGYFQSLEDNGVQDIINQEITQLLGGNITNNISSGDSFSSASSPGQATNTLEIEKLLTDRKIDQKKDEDDKLIAIISGGKEETTEDFSIGGLMLANF